MIAMTTRHAIVCVALICGHSLLPNGITHPTFGRTGLRNGRGNPDPGKQQRHENAADHIGTVGPSARALKVFEARVTEFETPLPYETSARCLTRLA